VALPDLGSHNSNGGLIGGTVGSNYQTGSWFFGVEADWDWANINSGTSCRTRPITAIRNSNRSAPFRHRVGCAWSQVPLYGTGGLTWANSRADTVNLAGVAVPPSGTPINGTNSTIVGWTLGAGIENGFWNYWSVKAEYLYADLGTHQYTVDFS
jgi:outer membrane immunogenic protein